MAIIYTLTTINTINVSPYVLSVKTDVKTSKGTGDMQQLDIVLANPGGIFDDKDWKADGEKWEVQTPIAVILFSEEYHAIDNPDILAFLVFTGKCQKINYGYTTVTVQAGCDGKQTASTLCWDPHKHYGQPSKPWIQAVVDMWSLKIGVIEESPVLKREWFSLGNVDGRSLIDEADAWDGKESWIDEKGCLNHRTVCTHKEFPVLTGRMKIAETCKRTINYFNQVTVRAGSWIAPTDPGAENRDQYVCYTTPIDPAEEKLHGSIKYETIMPELTTQKQCQERAEALLQMFKTNLDAAEVTVIGRSPDLTDEVSWQTMRLIGDGWQATALEVAGVQARKDEVSVQTGYVSNLTVEPWRLPTASSTDPTVIPDDAKPQSTYEDRANNAVYKGSDGNAYQHQWSLLGYFWAVSSNGLWVPASLPLDAKVQSAWDLVRTTNPSSAPPGVTYTT